MIRSALFSLLFVVLAASNSWSENVSDQNLGNKQILCVIEFAPNSNNLDKVSRHAVDSALNALQHIDTQTHLVRIEGYALPDESESSMLANNRAEAVEEFLRFAKGDYGDRYLTGIVLKEGADLPGHSPYRAEIVVYDNIFADAGTPLEITSKESR